MDKAQCADEPVVLRDGRHRKCKASQNAGSEYAAPKPQCKKLGAGAGKSFAYHRPTLTKKTHEMQAYRKKRVPQARQAQMDAGDAKRHKTWKRGLFHSPNIRITCIIRNFIKIQNRALSSFCFSPRLRSCLCCRSSLILRICNSPPCAQKQRSRKRLAHHCPMTLRESLFIISKYQSAFWLMSASASGSVPK